LLNQPAPALECRRVVFRRQQLNRLFLGTLDGELAVVSHWVVMPDEMKSCKVCGKTGEELKAEGK